MVEAWVANYVTPLKRRYDKYDSWVTSQKAHKMHKSPNKQHHHGGEAATSSGGVDLMNFITPGVGGLEHTFAVAATKGFCFTH